jgi:hypothetical protein
MGRGRAALSLRRVHALLYAVSDELEDKGVAGHHRMRHGFYVEVTFAAPWVGVSPGDFGTAPWGDGIP